MATIQITLVVNDRKMLDPVNRSGLTEEAEDQLHDAASGYGRVLDIIEVD